MKTSLDIARTAGVRIDMAKHPGHIVLHHEKSMLYVYYAHSVVVGLEVTVTTLHRKLRLKLTSSKNSALSNIRTAFAGLGSR